jgi:hypothetical protein
MWQYGNKRHPLMFTTRVRQYAALLDTGGLGRATAAPCFVQSGRQVGRVSFCALDRDGTQPLSGARDFPGNRDLNSPSLRWPNPIVETIKTVSDHIPKGGAAARRSEAAFVNAPKTGDMLLPRLTVDAHGLNDCRSPTGIARLATPKAYQPRLLSGLPSDEHGRSVSIRTQCATIYYTTRPCSETPQIWGTIFSAQDHGKPHSFGLFRAKILV